MSAIIFQVGNPSENDACSGALKIEGKRNPDKIREFKKLGRDAEDSVD